MSRLDNPVPQYLDASGDPLVAGEVFFFESGTSTPKTTFKDLSETLPNTNPVILTADGRLPNTFFTGLAKMVVTDSDSVQIFERDPVGDDELVGNFSNWDNTTIYSTGDIVIASDGKYYKSITSGNQSNDPTASPTEWLEIQFVNVWNTAFTFNINDLARASNGFLYRSLVGSNIGNEPSASPAEWGDVIPPITIDSIGQGTIGALITYDTSQDAVELVPSTANFLLTDNGVGAEPSYQELDISSDPSPQLGGFLDPNGEFIGRDKGADIVSASPLVIGTDGDFFDVTGVVGFSVMTVAANRSFVLQFDAAVIVTVGGGITLNNGGSNFTTAAGDIIVCQSTATDTVTGWILKADGTSLNIDINGQTSATVAAGDELLISDIDDSNNIKKVTAQSIADLNPFTEFFESTEQTITLDSDLSIVHGLSGTPSLIKLVLRCTTIDLGYAVGDEVDFSPANTASTDRNYQYGANATNVFVRTGVDISVLGVTFNGESLVESSWRYVFKAWL